MLLAKSGGSAQGQYLKQDLKDKTIRIVVSFAGGVPSASPLWGRVREGVAAVSVISGGHATLVQPHRLSRATFFCERAKPSQHRKRGKDLQQNGGG